MSEWEELPNNQVKCLICQSARGSIAPISRNAISRHKVALEHLKAIKLLANKTLEKNARLEARQRNLQAQTQLNEVSLKNPTLSLPVPKKQVNPRIEAKDLANNYDDNQMDHIFGKIVPFLGSCLSEKHRNSFSLSRCVFLGRVSLF